MCHASAAVMWFNEPQSDAKYVTLAPLWLASMVEAVQGNYDCCFFYVCLFSYYYFKVGRFVQPSLKTGIVSHNVLSRIWKPLVDVSFHPHIIALLRFVFRFLF